MPVFCARWPNGTFSIVEAGDQTHALIQLDELGDEPAEIWQLQSCLLDFELTDDGTFRLLQFGEETGPEIMERAYPLLSKAIVEADTSDQPEEVVRKAVDAERERVKDFQPAAATTEQGRILQRSHGGSAAYIDAIVQQAASGRLKRNSPGKDPKPS